LTQKSLKIDQKSTHFYTIKIGHNLTTKRGDSGSAGILEEKCVIIEAPNLDTKSDKNWSTPRKMTKNDQKSRNVKSEKIKKMEKVKKWQNWENENHEKVIKFKSLKNDKKSVKKWPPLKKAKMSLKWAKSTLCDFRAAWSGVFWVPGGTTGPGFKAEIRPPLFFTFFHVSWLHFSPFSCFPFSCFMTFSLFYVLCILTFLLFLLFWLKALLHYIKGSMMIVWWFLPSFVYDVYGLRVFDV